MKTAILMAYFNPRGRKQYPDVEKWKGEIIGIEKKSFANINNLQAHMIHALWAKEKIKNKQDSPEFGNVLAEDIIYIRTKYFSK